MGAGDGPTPLGGGGESGIGQGGDAAGGAGDRFYRLDAAFWRAEWPALAVLAAACLASAVILPHLGTAPVPVHWGLSGRPDRFATPRGAVVQSLGVTAGVYALLLVLPLIDPRRRSYGRFLPTLRAVRLGLVLLLVAVQAAALAPALGLAVDPGLAVRVIISLLFVFLGNLMPRLRPNWWIGIRTPWTLSSDDVWRRTHRVGGTALVVAGLLGLAMAAWGRPRLWLAAVLLVGAGWPVVYSYLDWRRTAGP